MLKHQPESQTTAPHGPLRLAESSAGNAARLPLQDNRPVAMIQRQMAASINASPRLVRQRALADGIAASPRMQGVPRQLAPPLQRAGVAVNDDAGLEHEADIMGAKADGLGAETLQAKPAGQAGLALAAPVIQRAVLSKLELEKVGEPPDDQFRVADVIIAGRTPSPFAGTMGAHSTAWIAHIDQVRRTMVNSSLSDAAENMLTLANAELDEAHDIVDEITGPASLYDLKDKMPVKHQELLTAARAQLQTDVEALTALNQPYVDTGITEVAVARAVNAALQKLINSYLTFINFLPGSTVQGGDPSGHGEASARSDISGAEYVLTHLGRNRQIDELDEADFSKKDKDEAKNSAIGEEIKSLSNKRCYAARSISDIMPPPGLCRVMSGEHRPAYFL